MTITTIPAAVFAAVGVALPPRRRRATVNPALLCIRLEPGAMVATCGHILTAARIEYNGPAVSVPVSDKAIAAAGKAKAVHVTWDPVTRIVAVVDAYGQELHMERAPMPEIDWFPDWRRLLAGPIGADPVRWYAPEVMGRLADTAAALEAESFAARGDREGISVVRYMGSAYDAGVFSPAMPMRIRTEYNPDSVDLPDWARA